jgi:hypothetical protein
MYIPSARPHLHLDIPTLLFTLLVVPLLVYFIGILKKHGKAWGGFLLEGMMYWFGRLVIHSLSARFSLRRYCRMQLQKENQYVFVPSKNDIKLEIDRVFVNLTMEQQGDGGGSFDQANILTAGPRIRVVGDPGSGKSSLVKRLFRDACREAIARPSKARFPVVIELKALKVPRNVSDQHLGEWFYNSLREAAKKIDVYKLEECFENYASSTGLLILLDGLDEVASANYERVYRALIAISEYAGNRSANTIIVLTMRTQLHQQVKDAFRTAFGKSVFIKPFSPTDVYEFLSRWPFTDQHLGPLIYAELTDRPTVREMCTNPLVLAMYVAERQSASDPITPESRTEFYGRVVEELLVKRRQRQTGATGGASKLREQRETILGTLAYEHLLDKNQPLNSLRWKDAIRVVKAVLKTSDEKARLAFLDIARDTGLVSEERPGESFRFTHLTFCEFLAAHESTEGQTHGVETLISAHKKMGKDPETGPSTRLLEALPFACGLVPRSMRAEAISGIAAIGDSRLLARCFLETKSYDHPTWREFSEKERNEILDTPEEGWNEKWLRDLHLFNVVVRDAAQCSAHSPLEVHKSTSASFTRL